MKIINLILLTLLIALQYRLWNGQGSLPEVAGLQEIKARQIEENQVFRERNLALAAEVHDLKQGLAAVEERARSEMGMIKKGETFFQLVAVPDPAASAGTDREE